MTKSYYVVTRPDLGWDCVVGLYRANSESEVHEYLCEEKDITLEESEERYVLHEHDVTEL